MSSFINSSMIFLYIFLSSFLVILFYEKYLMFYFVFIYLYEKNTICLNSSDMFLKKILFFNYS